MSNFQAFGETDRFERADLAPLTLIYGPNGSGKSSIGRALRLLAQSHDSPDGLKFNGELVSLGSHETTVFSNESSRDLGFDLKLTPGRRSQRFNGQRVKVLSAGIKIEASSECEMPGVIDLSTALSYPVESEPEQRLQVGIKLLKSGDHYRLVELELSDRQARLIFGDVDVERGAELVAEVQKLKNRLSFELDHRPGGGLVPAANPKELHAIGTSVLADFIVFNVALIRESLSRDLGAFAYCGPIRTVSSDIIVPSTKFEPLHSDASNLQEVLGAMPEEEFAEVSETLTRITSNSFGLKRERFASENPLMADRTVAVVEDKLNGTLVHFRDVGAGLSQLVPIIVHLYGRSDRPNYAETSRRGSYSRRNLGRGDGVVFLEQPELHLHPRMQGLVGDYLLDQSTKGRGPQVICETHSESLIHRIQKKIRTGAARPDQVSVLFVDRFPGEKYSYISKLGMRSDGTFQDKWPLSFSELRLADRAGDYNPS